MSEKTVYVKISLNTGSSYLQPVEDLGVLISEIEESIPYDLDSVWTISLVEMDPEEYAKLHEFEGH